LVRMELRSERWSWCKMELKSDGNRMDWNEMELKWSSSQE
jgi:hypothetical protein